MSLDQKNFDTRRPSIFLIIIRKFTAFLELCPSIEDGSTGQLLLKKIAFGQFLPLQ